MRKNIHLNRTVNLSLGIIPGGRGTYNEFNCSEPYSCINNMAKYI